VPAPLAGESYEECAQRSSGPHDVEVDADNEGRGLAETDQPSVWPRRYVWESLHPGALFKVPTWV
jgi:hypothetical protein